MIGTLHIEAKQLAVGVRSRVALSSSYLARHARGLLSLLGMACALAVGCDQGEQSSEQRRACARFCDLLEKCDDGTDLLDCTRDCESDEVRSIAYFRARADCGDELSCNQWMSEVDSQGDDLCSGEDCNLNQCVDHALREEKLTAEQERRCEVISNMLSNCDSSLSVSQVAEECERIAPLLSENYLEDSETCVLAPCAKMGRCLDDLAERHNTDLKVFAGIFTPR